MGTLHPPSLLTISVKEKCKAPKELCKYWKKSGKLKTPFIKAFKSSWKMTMNWKSLLETQKSWKKQRPRSTKKQQQSKTNRRKTTIGCLLQAVLAELSLLEDLVS